MEDRGFKRHTSPSRGTTRKRWRPGAGMLVAAAFVGPGTIVTATAAGAAFKLALIWVIIVAVVATIALQEMAARLGVVTGAGLGEAIRQMPMPRTARLILIFLTVVAICAGNAVFEMGNLLGAGLGIQAVLGGQPTTWALVSAGGAALLLATGTYATVERVLVGMVLLMSALFIAVAIMTGPDVMDMMRALARPSIPAGAGVTVLALIGTTVVPYNLFLHASAAARHASDAPGGRGLRWMRWDTAVSVAVGGAITLAIVVTASAAYGDGRAINSAIDMSRQLEPMVGPAARWLFAAGLFAAGLTSAITAPLAAAYAAAGALGFSPEMTDVRFRLVWGTVILVGVLLVLGGTRPDRAIVVAQAANGLLLPAMAVLLLVAVNRQAFLKEHVNGWLSNALGIFVVTGVGLVTLVTLWRRLAP